MKTARNFKEGRTMKRLAISFLAAAALAGCAKLGLETVESTPSEEQAPFVLYVSTSSEAQQLSSTKTSFNEKTYEVTWSDNDAIAVTINNDHLYKFTKVKDKDNAFACSEFVPKEGEVYEYDILYPYDDKGQYATSGYAKTPMHGTAKAVGSASPNVRLKQLTCVIKVTVKNENAVGTAKLTTLRIERTDGGILGGQHTVKGEPVNGDTFTQLINQDKKVAAGKSMDICLQCAPFTAKAGTSLLFKYTVDGTDYTETKTFSKDVVFAAGKVNRTSISCGEAQYFIDGTVLTGGAKLMPKTPESSCVYAEEVYLRAGKMTIPVKYKGVTSYICPTDGSVEVPDNDQVDSKPAGTLYNAVVKKSAEGSELPVWNIPVEGYWRVIIDTENNTVKFFSPKNRLEPLTFEFAYEGRNPASWILTKTLKAGNYYLNSMTGWDSWKGRAFSFVVSKVDPMILIWSGSSFSVPDKNAGICIKVAQHRADLDSIKQGEGTGGNDPYTDTGVKDKDKDKDKDDISTTFVSKVAAFGPATAPGIASSNDMELKTGEWMNTALVVSNKRWKLASSVKISKITIDARNNKIRFD